MLFFFIIIILIIIFCFTYKCRLPYHSLFILPFPPLIPHLICFLRSLLFTAYTLMLTLHCPLFTSHFSILCHIIHYLLLTNIFSLLHIPHYSYLTHSTHSFSTGQSSPLISHSSLRIFLFSLIIHHWLLLTTLF